MKSPRWVVVTGAVAVLALSLATCGPKETARDRVTRVRQQYEVRPSAYQPRIANDGTPEVVLDLLVLKQGQESVDTLTVLVRVVGENGEDKAEARVPLDVAGLRSGVTEQVTALVKGLKVDSGDSVFLEVEISPPAQRIADYPEYRNALS